MRSRPEVHEDAACEHVAADQHLIGKIVSVGEGEIALAREPGDAHFQADGDAAMAVGACSLDAHDTYDRRF